VWRRDYVEGENDSGRDALQTFLEDEFDDDGELLLFTGGSEFEYSRTVTESDTVEFSSEVAVSTESSFSHEFESKTGALLFGNGATVNLKFGSQASISSAQILDKTRESSTESEQTVGFVLADGDVWDSFATYVHEGPWGTPIFFTDPGSVTSWPWEQGTVKGVDVQLELISSEDNGPFDYRDGAHYQFRVTSIGKGVKEGSGFDFMFYDLPIGNPKSAVVQFNGSDEAPYMYELFKGFSGIDLINGVEEEDGIGVASANIMVSIYPPQRDWDNTIEVEYPVVVQSESAKDYQIAVNKVLRPRFADLRAPRATVTAPYDGQRISPTLFTTEGFEIEAFCDDEDVAQVQIQIRTKQPDSVYEPWQNLSGMLWQDGGANDNVTIVTHTERDPQRKEFTFDWAASDISSLGVGEYQLRAVSQDAATRLSADGSTQTAMPNVDLDAPVITFRVDDSEPTVLTTVPFYQDRESERIYRAELSVIFTDDMRADDFNDRSFEVVDLLDNAMRVAGFVSYSPTLRKAAFVPVQPLIPNGFYRATIKTDSETGEVDAAGEPIIDRGLHDLAGNPLDQEFSWTFRTTDSPFEEEWSLTFSVTDNVSTNANNIAGVEYGALDMGDLEEDERDARAAPGLSQQLRFSFLNMDKVEFDRDMRPADGRLSHHWFFVIIHAANSADVTIQWQPSIKLASTLRQYQDIWLVEFNADSSVKSRIQLDPTEATFNENTAEFDPVEAYTYTNEGETSRYFRLDVQKSSFVAETLLVGTSGWRFLSVPIIPERAEPFVNLGDDIDPFQLYQYDTEIGGYKIYPFDIGEVALQTGHGYFTRLEDDVEVDVGGAQNYDEVTLTLDVAGWMPLAIRS